MTDSIPCVGASFPQTGKEKTVSASQLARDTHQASVSRRDAIIQDIDELVCAKIFALSGVSFSLRELRGGKSIKPIMRMRRWAWWLLRNHPSARCTWPCIGSAYGRHHSTVLSAVRLLHERLLDGLAPEDWEILQSLADNLARRGHAPFAIGFAL